MKLSFGRRGAVALAAASVAVVLAAAPGTASAATGWQLATTFSQTGSLQTASASSTSNEWVARSSASGLLVEHRTASGWRRVATPDLKLLAPNGGMEDVQVAAVPGGGAWVFLNVVLGSTYHIVATQWNGSSWSAPTSLPDDLVTKALALSATDVWAFGDTAWHYNGKSWSNYRSPWTVDAASGSASAGLWILGRGFQGARVAAAHWTRRGWQVVPLPKSVPAGSYTFADAIVATGPKDVWASMEYRPKFGPTFYGYLLHWNGTAWSLVRLPSIHVRPRQMASDGHGGLWVIPDERYLYHYSDGRWALLRVPGGKDGDVAAIDQLVAVPGTTSLLGAGRLTPPGSVSAGAVYTYGS